MRNKKAFLFLALVTATGLIIAPTAVIAADPPPTSCSTSNGYTISVAEGTPCAVQCGLPLATGAFCSEGGPCTGIEYLIEGPSKPDHVAGLARSTGVPFATDTWVNGPKAQGSSIAIFEPCQGDTTTGMGKHSCHERTYKINPAGASQGFRVVVQGDRKVIPVSVAVKKGNATSATGACEIAGLGEEVVVDPNRACVSSCGNFNAFQTMTKTEILKFKGCYAEFVYDLSTGDIISHTLLTSPPYESATGCLVRSGNAQELSLRLNGNPLPGNGVVEFGDGTLGVGDDSATYRFVGGRWYCTGTDCP